ncbi:transcriptional regulator [Burkholderia sp. Nafp2/4-1b]|uniref:winged helix-turn-helix domain-containing protein n=1 Tax=Burkholderia sp. Nafp2/4-1b TaxID=2116686 RepID=UPI000EF9200B|nr:winged helix-turn-helix domain-containing protein [Burkholderia sp. Nafp2/4-1b]RKT98640.1 transcriptional regulator [Burkholderia sp. Nafp2/4-1b]
MNRRYLYVDNIQIDFVFRAIKIDGKVVRMTPCAFDVLEFLLRNKNEMVSRRAIQRAVWGRELDASSRTLEAHISQIRSKLRLDEHKKIRIITVYSMGYRLALDDPETSSAEPGDPGSTDGFASRHTMGGPSHRRAQWVATNQVPAIQSA